MLYFLKIQDYPGESTNAAHKEEIDVLSLSWGLSQSLTVQSPATAIARASFQEVNFVMRTSRSSGALMLACAQGTHLNEATFYVRKDSNAVDDFLQIKLSDVLVSSVSESGADELLQSLSLNYGKIEHVYKRQVAINHVEITTPFGWDVAKNAKL